MTSPKIFQPGDVLVVNASKGRGFFSAGWWIKLRSFLMSVKKRSRYVDHVVIVHHLDEAGTLWGIEGKPSNVGWVDVQAEYIKPGKLIADNCLQPKTESQRAEICKVAEEMIGTKYDWVAILALGAEVNFINELWDKWNSRLIFRDWDEDKVPGHVICSSYAALVYQKADLNHPLDFMGKTRYVDPDDWAEFCFSHQNQFGWTD